MIRNKEIEKWPFLDGEFQDHQFCPCCGLVLYVDEWLDIEVAQHKIMQKLYNLKKKSTPSIQSNL
jgi:hypothetical protein